MMEGRRKCWGGYVGSVGERGNKTGEVMCVGRREKEVRSGVEERRKKGVVMMAVWCGWGGESVGEDMQVQWGRGEQGWGGHVCGEGREEKVR